MLCNACKTSGHPTALCPFPNIPRWQESTAIKLTAHKVTLQMYEDQVQKQGRGRGHGGAQREYQNYQEGRNHA